MIGVTRVRPEVAVCQSPPVLAALTVGLGLAAHLVSGGRSIECLPLLAAAGIGVLTALSTRRIAGQVYDGAFAAVTLLGVGLWGAHIALSEPLNGLGNGESLAAESARITGGFNHGVLAVHAPGTTLLVIFLLGACQAVEVALHLLALGRQRWIVCIVAAPPATAYAVRKVFSSRFETIRNRGARHWGYGLSRPRRGPPLTFAG